MSKRYKKKNDKVDEIDNIQDENELSKKELYDLNKKKKMELKEKESKKKVKNNKKKKKESTHKASLLARIFAILMLILMIGSVLATVSNYIR